MMDHKRISLYIFLVLLISTLAYSHGWMAPKKSAAIKNPVYANKESIKLGRSVFNDYCAGCHAENARGMSAEAAGLDAAAPDLIERAKVHSDGDIFWKINTGKGEMPSFKEDLEEKEVWSLILFVRSL